MKARIDGLAKKLFSNWHAKVIALAASLFIFVFYRLSTQHEILVPLLVTLPAGYEISNERPETVSIIMRGSKVPENLTKDNFKATIDLASFIKGGSVRGKVVVERLGDAAKLGVLEYEVQPAEVSFVLEPALEKYVPVNIRNTVAGTLAHGYSIESVAVVPETVLIRGPKSRVEKIRDVTTETLDITGETGVVSGVVRLLSNDGFIRLVNATEAQVSVVIAEMREKRTFENVTLNFDGLPEDLVPVNPGRGRLEIEGSVLFLEGVKTDELALIVDCAPVKAPDEYSLMVVGAQTPAGAGVVSYEPKTLTVRFEKKQ